MTEIDILLVPYMLSQLVAMVFLLASWYKTRLARLFFSLLFTGAAVVNLYTGINSPKEYQNFADLALPLYRNFIKGIFWQFTTPIIIMIGLGQLMIGAGMLLRKTWVSLACWGAILFLLAITPLGFGAAFPSTVVLAAAAVRILTKDNKEYLWKNTGTGQQPIHTKQGLSLLNKRKRSPMMFLSHKPLKS